MRNAETILTIIRKRGQRGLRVQDVYRLLYQRNFYLCAYGKLYRNKGAMTEGSTPETADGMTLEKIDNIIKLLRNERYRWTPVRRTYIPKKNKKLRSLNLPTWSDKILQEVIRLILEAYYEPQFSNLILQPFSVHMEEKYSVVDTTVFQKHLGKDTLRLNVFVYDYKIPPHIQKYFV